MDLYAAKSRSFMDYSGSTVEGAHLRKLDRGPIARRTSAPPPG
jgi:hypothetical protein